MNTEIENKTKFAPELSIGERLANVRKSEGISLSKASNVTKLKVTYLEALEQDNFDVLPAPIYAKNFIKIYGNYLGLDGEALAIEFAKKSEEPPLIPETPKVSFSYYVSMCFNAIVKNLFLAAAVAACVILFFIIFKTPEETDAFVIQNDKQPIDFVTELESYTPVYDFDEPLPIIKQK